MFRSISLVLVVVVLGCTAGEPEVAPAVIQVNKNIGDVDTKTDLALEKRELDKQLCAGNKGIDTVTNDTGRPASISTNEKINETIMSEDKGPKKVIILEEKLEEFPDNGSKIVVVKEVSEKLPSNDTVKEITVERKTIKDTDTETNEPKQEITVEKEVENQVRKVDFQELNKLHEEKTQELKAKIKDVKQEIEKVKEEIKEEEIKSKGIDPSLCKLQEPVVTVTKTVEKKMPQAAVKVVEQLVPIVKTGEKIDEKVQPVVSLGGNVTNKVTPEIKNKEIIVVKKDNNTAEEILDKESQEIAKEIEIPQNLKESIIENRVVIPSNVSNVTTEETKAV